MLRANHSEYDLKQNLLHGWKEELLDNDFGHRIHIQRVIQMVERVCLNANHEVQLHRVKRPVLMHQMNQLIQLILWKCLDILYDQQYGLIDTLPLDQLSNAHKRTLINIRDIQV